MPLSLHGAAAIFQRLMDQVLDPVSDFATAYIDDIVVYSQLWEEHIKHLRAVLQELAKASLTVNPLKCRLAKGVVEYLGFKVGNGSIIPNEGKIDKISVWPRPKDKKGVQKFLGLAGYYCQFIPNFAEIVAPLTDLTRKKANKMVKWGDREEPAFNKIKDLLCSERIRHAPDFSLPFFTNGCFGQRCGAVLT